MADSGAYDLQAQRNLRLAARAVARAGLVHAYGHCSLRLDSERFFVTPPKPLGLVNVDEPAVICPIEGPLPAQALGEVLAHQQIYQRRPEVRGIVRFQSPQLTALSALGRTPRARHGFSAYFAPEVPMHADPRLVRDARSAGALVSALATARAVVMRGNGAIAVGGSLEEAVVMAWYLEDSARVELAVLNSGLPGEELTADEARERAVTSGRIIERMWDWLTAGDPELERQGVAHD